MNNTEKSKLEIVREIAERQQCLSTLAELDKIEQIPTIKIGFIGAFSSGKTSLINSIMGTELPVNTRPTTKSICLIESSAGISEPAYYEVLNGEKSPVSFITFDSIVNGKKDGIAAIVVPPSKDGEALPEGCMFVDTPGIDTPTGTDEIQTFLYLNSLDAAVFCIDSNHGSMTKTEEEFLCSGKLNLIRDRIGFALTWSDHTQNDIPMIRQNIIAQINKLNHSDRICIHNVEQKVFAVSSHDKNAEKVYSFLKDNVLEYRESVYADRREQELKKCVSDLFDILKTIEETLDCDPNKIDEKIEQCKTDIDTIRTAIKERETSLEQFETALAGNILNKLGFHIPFILKARENNVKDAIGDMMKDLTQWLNDEVRRYSSSVSVPESIVGFMGPHLAKRITRIEKVKDVSVALATTTIVAAASAAAAANEAAASTAKEAAKAATKEAAQKTAEEAAKAAAKAAAEKAAEEAAKATAKAKVLTALAKVFSSMNPLDPVGDISAHIAKEQLITPLLNDWSKMIARNVCDLLDEPYRKEVIQPLENEINTKKQTLEQMKEEARKNIYDFCEKKKSIRQDIDKANKLF